MWMRVMKKIKECCEGEQRPLGILVQTGGIREYQSEVMNGEGLHEGHGRKKSRYSWYLLVAKFGAQIQDLVIHRYVDGRSQKSKMTRRPNPQYKYFPQSVRMLSSLVLQKCRYLACVAFLTSVSDPQTQMISLPGREVIRISAAFHIAFLSVTYLFFPLWLG